MGGGVLSNLFRKVLGGAGDDIANKVASQYSDDVVRTLATSSADDIAAKQGNLIATHQLTPEKLSGVADLGGFVQPSMAVVDPSKGKNFLPGSGFGDIVMVSNRDTINPAKRAAKSIIGDRDIYSPRFPDAEYTVNEGVLKQLADEAGESYNFALSNLDLTGSPEHSSFMRTLYNKRNPAAADMSLSELRQNPDFLEFAKQNFDQLRGDMVYSYKTPSGQFKTLPGTAENASKIMNKSSVIGGERGWQTPYTTVYHQNTKTFNSLDDLYKNRNRFVDAETGDVTKDKIRDHMGELIDKLVAENPDQLSGFQGYDTAGDYVADLASNANASWGDWINISDDLRAQIDDLQKLYKDVPVSYFEAKPRRVVKGNEFYGAYIPQDSSPEVIEQLQRLGVENIRKYLDPADLDTQLSSLASEGKRGVSPYVLGLGGILPGAGVLSQLFGGQPQPEEQELI